jgi:hypothetical protein
MISDDVRALVKADGSKPFENNPKDLGSLFSALRRSCLGAPKWNILSVAPPRALGSRTSQ